VTGGSAGAHQARALSVVVACDGSLDRVADRLHAIAVACEGIDAEAILVHAADTPVALPRVPPIATSVIAAPSTLVPVLWGRGIHEARGRIVALSTTQFRVRESWARELCAAFMTRDVVGAGGIMALPRNADALTRAVFLIRYSEHMSNATEPADIAGDNAAYLRDAVLRACPDVAAGFWEVDVHRVMRAHGGRIVHAPRAVAEFEPALSARAMVANRFVHGSHFGAYRVRALGWPRWRAVAVTPLVPAVLLARIAARLRRARQPLAQMLPLLPAMGLLLGAWAAGEARGALSRREA
jgi:hypothetical protein